VIRPCAEISRALGEPLHGTASRVRNWLLIEHDGEWGRDAVRDSTLDPAVMQSLKRIADQFKIRLLLIRKPHGDREDGNTVFTVHSDVAAQWIQRMRVDDPAALVDIDFSTMRLGVPPLAGELWDGPLYLVCTHGEHDPCCGRYGRAVAEGLARHRFERAWASSHVGGDRFAANLVCLPHGLYFGRVSPEEAGGIVDLYEQERIDLGHYRGRSCFDPIVQAADILLRKREHLDGIDDLEYEWRQYHSADEATLGFRDRSGARHEIRVRGRRGERRHITCRATRPGAPREYAVAPDGS
jgi:hypothetical protein